VNTSFPEVRDTNRQSRQRLGALAAFLLAAMLTASCLGGDGDPAEQTTPETTPTSAATATAPATQSATAEPTTPVATPTASATPSATLDPADETAKATAAASEVLGGAATLDALDRAACEAANPASRICIELLSDGGTVAAGTALFRAGDLDGGGFLFFMGRLVDGSWGYWFGTQQTYDTLDALPGTLVACGLGGDVEVHGAPGGAVTGTVPHLEQLTAEEFALKEPGQFAAGGTRGKGWYRISAPAAGWVSADHATDAAFGDCLLHEELLGARG
jgi:hypothetical protein